MGNQSWRSIFVGREDELKLLHHAWDQAKEGSPQFVTFLAETGVGKTRLVQHFYSELTKQEDPDHYWPDSMDSAASSLAINPQFPETKSKEKSHGYGGVCAPVIQKAVTRQKALAARFRMFEI